MSAEGNTFTISQEFASSDGTGSRDYTGFIFNATGDFSYEFGGSFLDEGASVFFVDESDVFSESNILGGDFIELGFGTSYDLPFAFFLGIRTPAQGVDFGSSPPAYGWAEIQNFGNGDLVLVDHAVAYNSRGIIVDTLTAVPEPDSAILGCSAMLLLIRRRRAEEGLASKA